MAIITNEEVLAALRNIEDPDKGDSIVALGMVTGLVVKDGNVAFTIEVEPDRGPYLESLRQEAEDVVGDLSGVISVTAVLTAERVQASPRQGENSHNNGQSDTHAPLLQSEGFAQNLGRIIAVASGKGGVGKSTVAVNLALALAAAGHKVGLFDADIYGPSQPRMMGITGKPESLDNEKLEPMMGHGIKVMSMGFLVAEDTPMIWRGPMVMGALQQMLRDVNWGELDVMIVDMPPGTGDAQLTMAQQVPLAGVVIVSTPQDIALLDARKGLNMFRKVDVPVIGIIENMSYFRCPGCGQETHIFSHGGARTEADSLGIEFLGEIPLDIDIRTTSDKGQPIVVSQPENDQAKAFRLIADRVWAKLSTAERVMPKIVVE